MPTRWLLCARGKPSCIGRTIAPLARFRSRIPVNEKFSVLRQARFEGVQFAAKLTAPFSGVLLTSGGYKTSNVALGKDCRTKVMTSFVKLAISEVRNCA